MIDQGATTLWERWDAWTEESGYVPNASLSHTPLGSAVAWLFDTVAGIRPAEPGFRSVTLAPTSNDLAPAAPTSHRIAPEIAQGARAEERVRMSKRRLTIARRLVEAGVSVVTVCPFGAGPWDTHSANFSTLRKMLPPLDQALSALHDDLDATGLLDSTLVVMAGEFGRTPRISSLPQYYKRAGRDHWGKVQTVWFAGGGDSAVA